ncbi:MAG: SURF1 family protein [Microbacteriaceae bacterium]|nr:SURF1 family protein [Microbacteriaceae bacterium]
MTSSLKYGFIKEPRWIGLAVLLAMIAVGCVAFGIWQFDRRAEAAQKIELLEANWDAPAKSWDAFFTVPETGESNATQEWYDQYRWQSVTLQGQFDYESAVTVRNRFQFGEMGKIWLVPFTSNEGIVWVDRGWLYPDDAIPYNGPGQNVTVVIRATPIEPKIPGRDDIPASGTEPASLASIHTEALSEVPDAINSMYFELVSENPAAATGTALAKPELDEGPHLSYALQWFVFALMAIFGYFWLVRNEAKALAAIDEAHQVLEPEIQDVQKELQNRYGR